jgi:hypothetical protein
MNQNGDIAHIILFIERNLFRFLAKKGSDLKLIFQSEK